MMKRKHTHFFVIGLAWACLGIVAQSWAFDLGGAIGSVTKIVQGTQDIGPEDELSMGRQFSALVLGAYPPNSNNDLNEYVSEVGLTVAQVSSRPDLHYHFQVLHALDANGQPIINAFSTPGGYIFVTKGLLSTLDSEAALAGILAHEVAHVAEKHVLKEIKRQNIKTGLQELGGNIATAAGVNENFATVLAPALANNLFEKGLSKGDEYRADAAAISYVTKAGYDPHGLLHFLEVLKNQEGKGNYATLLRTHPKPADRIDRINKLITAKQETAGVSLTERWRHKVRQTGTQP